MAIQNQLDRSYIKWLYFKLESLEGEFIHELCGIKSPSSERGYIKKTKESLLDIRSEAKGKLEAGESSGKIQKVLTEGFQQLLIKMIHQAMALLGAPSPEVKYAVLALGALGREEMGPYSNVKLAFLIKEPDQKEYFTKLAQLLEIKLMLLEDTAFEIGTLTSIAPKEHDKLIGTPKELAAYQSEEWIKNHVDQLLFANKIRTSSKLVGDKGLFEKYQNAVRNNLDESLGSFSFFSSRQKVREKRALQLLTTHISDFGSLLTQEKVNLTTFNVEEEFILPFHQILDGLSIYYNLKHVNTYERINEILQKNFLSPEGAQNLKKAFEMASMLNLRSQFHSSFSISDNEHQLILEISKILFHFHRSAIAFSNGDKEAFKLRTFTQ